VVPASGSEEALPSSVTDDNSSTDWSTPAAANGVRLVFPPVAGASDPPPPHAANSNDVDRTAVLLYQLIKIISLLRCCSILSQYTQPDQIHAALLLSVIGDSAKQVRILHTSIVKLCPILIVGGSQFLSENICKAN
jgi:hypothetical protein